jgi:hypothetical protein
MSSSICRVAAMQQSAVRTRCLARQNADTTPVRFPVDRENTDRIRI